MRQWLQQDDPPRGWMVSNVDAIMDTEEKTSREKGDGVVRWKHAGDRAEVREMCRAAVHQLEDDLITRLRLSAPPAHGWDPAPRFEVPVTIPHPAGHREKILLVGEIDLLIRTPEGTEVWDLKTTRDSQYWRKVLGQLVFYEIAVWGMTGQWPVRSGLLQPLCAETQPCWTFTQDHRLQMFQRIIQVAGDIWEGRVAPKKDNTGCSYCDVRHACAKFPAGRGRVPSQVSGI